MKTNVGGGRYLDRNLKKGYIIDTSFEPAIRAFFHCSDGLVSTSFRRAYKHEMYIRIQKFFPESAFGKSKKFAVRKGYYITRHDYIKCGVYRIRLENETDLKIINYWFRGVEDEIPELVDSDYPYEFDIEIYYEEYPGVIVQKGQWRLYNEDYYR